MYALPTVPKKNVDGFLGLFPENMSYFKINLYIIKLTQNWCQTIIISKKF